MTGERTRVVACSHWRDNLLSSTSSSPSPSSSSSYCPSNCDRFINCWCKQTTISYHCIFILSRRRRRRDDHPHGCLATIVTSSNQTRTTKEGSGGTCCLVTAYSANITVTCSGEWLWPLHGSAIFVSSSSCLQSAGRYTFHPWPLDYYFFWHSANCSLVSFALADHSAIFQMWMVQWKEEL